jgi:hypothetical protein
LTSQGTSFIALQPGFDLPGAFCCGLPGELGPVQTCCQSFGLRNRFVHYADSAPGGASALVRKPSFLQGFFNMSKAYSALNSVF